MIIDTAGQVIGAQLVSNTSGAAFTGAVTVYITIDAETQTIGSVGSGLCTHEGNGYHTYRPSQAETNGAFLAFTFIGTGAIPRTIQIETESASQAAAVATTTATGAVSVASLIIQAAKRVNVLAAGQTLSPEDMADMFTILQYWMDGLQAERLALPFIQRTVWTISSTEGTIANPYTVGTGGDVDVTRPAFISSINYQDTSISPTLERGLYLYTDQTWAGEAQKNLTGVYPTRAYYNPTYAGNFGSLYLTPIPSSTTLQGVLYAPAAIARFSSTADTIILPPGYLHFIRENLAVEIGTSWRDGIPLDPQLLASARMSKERIKALNVRPMEMSLDPCWTGGGWYDINAGNY